MGEPRKEDRPMNFEKALGEFEGNREILMELLWRLIEDVRGQIERIHKAVSDGNIEVVRREAHTIKGGAAMLTANDLSRVASELEQIAKYGSLEGSTGIIERIEKEFNRLVDYVRKYEKGS
jgi:HPt (histidine-containing phosphotransfer) domain-containing protein